MTNELANRVPRPPRLSAVLLTYLDGVTHRPCRAAMASLWKTFCRATRPQSSPVRFRIDGNCANAIPISSVRWTPSLAVSTPLSRKIHTFAVFALSKRLLPVDLAAKVKVFAQVLPHPQQGADLPLNARPEARPLHHQLDQRRRLAVGVADKEDAPQMDSLSGRISRLASDNPIPSPRHLRKLRSVAFVVEAVRLCYENRRL